MDFLIVVEGKAMNCVPTSGQHRVFSSLQSCTGTLALKLVIKLEFQTFKHFSQCLKKLQLTSPKQLSRTWLLGNRPLMTISQFLPKERKIVNIHILRKLLVFQLSAFLPCHGLQFISVYFILYLVFINNSKVFQENN